MGVHLAKRNRCIARQSGSASGINRKEQNAFRLTFPLGGEKAGFEGCIYGRKFGRLNGGRRWFGRDRRRDGGSRGWYLPCGRGTGCQCEEQCQKNGKKSHVFSFWMVHDKYTAKELYVPKLDLVE